jgi:hypothetical protein
MNKFSKLALLILAGALIFSSCDLLNGMNGDENGNGNGNGGDGDNGIDYTNYLSNYSIKVKNDANQKLVAFKGAPSRSSLISGIPIGGGEHGLKKDTVLFAATGDFVLFLVTEADYLANKDNLSSLANKPFTRIYAFYNR